jgi:protein gp37
MSESSIEWTDRVWNPVRGCSLVSKGCENCYAMKQAHRFSGPGGAYEGLTKLTSHGPVWTGEARFVPEKLGEPLTWRKPQRVFVNSMSDLFHEDISFDQIDRVFAVMALASHHTFQILTKRPARMAEYFARTDLYVLQETDEWRAASDRIDCDDDPNGSDAHHAKTARLEESMSAAKWPLPNVWLGVSCENQQAADERIPLLLQTPAAVRFVSAEPLLGPIDFDSQGFLEDCPGIDGCPDPSFNTPSVPGLDWLIVGGESGPGARPCAEEWIEDIIGQCASAKVPLFVKQLGAVSVSEERAYKTDEEGRANGLTSRWAWSAGLKDRKGGDPSEWPEHWRVRQFPEVRRG